MLIICIYMMSIMFQGFVVSSGCGTIFYFHIRIFAIFCIFQGLCISNKLRGVASMLNTTIYIFFNRWLNNLGNVEE